jgi:hypothetical protein
MSEQFVLQRAVSGSLATPETRRRIAAPEVTQDVWLRDTNLDLFLVRDKSDLGDIVRWDVGRRGMVSM